MRKTIRVIQRPLRQAMFQNIPVAAVDMDDLMAVDAKDIF